MDTVTHDAAQVEWKNGFQIVFVYSEVSENPTPMLNFCHLEQSAQVKSGFAADFKVRKLQPQDKKTMKEIKKLHAEFAGRRQHHKGLIVQPWAFFTDVW